MSALGGFAKGLSDGLQAGQNYRLKDAQAERDAKVAGWAEEEHNRKVKLQGEEDAALEQQKATYQQYYGEQTVEEPDANGVVQKVVKPGKKFGQDPFHDMNYLSEVGAQSMLKRGANPKDLMAAAEYVAKFKETEQGKLLMGALAGNADAKAAVLKANGIDGNTAKWDVNPAKGIYKVTDATGKSIDLHGIAGYLGAEKAWQMMNQQTDTAQKTEKHGIDVAEGNLNINQVLPAKVSNLRAQTAEAGAKAGYYGANTNLIKAETDNVKKGLGKGGTGAAGSKRDPDGIIGRTIDSMDEFKGDTPMRLHATNIANKLIDNDTSMSPQQAALTAGTLLGQAQQKIRKNPEQFRGVTPEQLVDKYLSNKFKQ